jgi:hypothetical protein
VLREGRSDAQEMLAKRSKQMSDQAEVARAPLEQLKT